VFDHVGFFSRTRRRVRKERNMLMAIVTWLVLGLIAGFIASTLMNKRGEGAGMDIVLGIVGAVLGGWIFRALGSAGVTGFNLWSILVAIVGAVLVLGFFHAIKGSAIRS
jgi:uncharacterized membrane protein YeaQ/YmgE (transglycosylase-associated protein family)